MSVHFTLAKKVLGHFKDLFRMVANENGADFKREERELFAAVKDAATQELEKIEGELSDGLQSWQMAPAPGQATSIGGGADLSGDADADTDAEGGETAADPTASTSVPTASGETSEPSASSPASDTADTGADSSASQSAPAASTPSAPADTVSNPPAGEQHTFGDPDATAPTGDNSVGTLPPPVAVGPEQGAADFHGDALGSASAASSAPAQAELPLPSDSSSSSAPGGTSYTPPAQTAAAEPALGGTDPATAESAASAQSSVPEQKGDLDAQQGQGTPAEDVKATTGDTAGAGTGSSSSASA